MDFFKYLKLSLLLKPQVHSSPNGLGVEQRLHGRFPIAQTDLAAVVIGQDQSRFPILDLSYGGIAFQASLGDSKESLTPGSCIELTLRVLNATIAASATIVRTERGIVAASWRHLNNNTLIFLRDILEPLRWGTTLSTGKSDRDVWKDNRLSVRGDGPTEVLLVRRGNALLFASATFLQHGRVYEVALDHGRIQMRTAVTHHGFSAGDGESESTKEQLLRTVILVLANAPLQSQRPFVEEFMAAANIELDKANQSSHHSAAA